MHTLCKSQENKTNLLMHNRTYKKTMNKYINIYKHSQQKKLRKLQKSQPKDYWKFLNSLKNKKKSDMPPPNQFHEYFKNIYSFDEDCDEDVNQININNEAANESLNCPFTPTEIERCIQRLKN